MADPVEDFARAILRLAHQSQLDAGVIGYALMSCAAYVACGLGHQDAEAFTRTAHDAFTVVRARQRDGHTGKAS